MSDYTRTHTQAYDATMELMRQFCGKTECIKCIPEKELGCCAYDKLTDIFGLLKGE